VLAPTREGCAYVGPPASRWIACHGCVRGNLAWLEGNWCALISASSVTGVSDPRGREVFSTLSGAVPVSFVSGGGDLEVF
jgi:hypothetical protein